MLDKQIAKEAHKYLTKDTGLVIHNGVKIGAIENGADAVTVKDLLGHADLAITLSGFNSPDAQRFQPRRTEVVERKPRLRGE